MFRRRPAISVLASWLVLTAVTHAEEKKSSNAAPAASESIPEEARQVRVYRLHHAEAASLVKELSALLDSRRIRLASYAPSNALIVMGPQDVQATMADLIGRLDAPATQSAAQPVRAVGDIRSTRCAAAQTGRAAQSNEPADNQEDTVKVIRVPHRDLAALAKALSAVAESRGSSVRTVIVSPPAQQQPVQQASRPTDTQRR